MNLDAAHGSRDGTSAANVSNVPLGTESSSKRLTSKSIPPNSESIREASEAVSGDVSSSFESVNLTFVREGADPLNLDPKQISEIDQHRSHLFQQFEDKVIVPFARALAEKDPESIVKVVGSYNDPNRPVRIYSDVDLIVLSPLLKDPRAYTEALLQLSQLTCLWRDSVNEGKPPAESIAPFFFTQAAHETRDIMILKLDSKCDALNIVPCHFLFYRDEVELIQREALLGHRLLEGSRPALERRGHTDAVFLTASTKECKMSKLDPSIWNIERALADLVLNTNLMPSPIFDPIYASHLHATIRQLVDILPISDSDKNIPWILKNLDPDKGNGLRRAFKPIDSLRNLPYEEFQRVELVTPAVMMIQQLQRLMQQGKNS